MKILLLHLILIALFVLSVPSPSGWADCTDLYPDTDVETALNKSEYQNCTLNVMVQNYSDYLQEIYRLLNVLRPAYSRKLNKEVADERMTANEMNVRLSDYDTNLADLLSEKNSLGTLLSEMTTNTDADSGNEISQETQNALEEKLNKCKETSQALKRKIKQTKEEILESENNDFCKLDFIFRVSRSLNTKINTCL